MEYHFSFEIQAPDGLNNLEENFENSDLNLHIWESGYNGKNILLSSSYYLVFWILLDVAQGFNPAEASYGTACKALCTRDCSSLRNCHHVFYRQAT